MLTNLKQLEIWLEITGYFRGNIPEFAQVTEPLYIKKTFLLKDISTKDNFKKRFFIITPYKTIIKKIKIFKKIKTHIINKKIIVFFNPNY